MSTGNLVVVGTSATLGDAATLARAAVAVGLYGLGAFAAARPAGTGGQGHGAGHRIGRGF